MSIESAAKLHLYYIIFNNGIHEFDEISSHPYLNIERSSNENLLL